MASTYIPVETILKVDDNELLIRDNESKTEEYVAEASSHQISTGTQCNWKIETNSKACTLFPENEESESKYSLINPNQITVGERNEDLSLLIRNWPSSSDSNFSSEQKFLIPSTFPQQFSCNIQALPVDEKFFLQFDYKTRNKLKTKQRRLDPYYRTQERVRQRTVMRIKRQDPRFRAAEREKGRHRMRLKRLDPVFRSQERERQRERMKLKRSNPDFREKEREQQKTRLHIKRLDSAIKNKKQTLDEIRMRIVPDDSYSHDSSGTTITPDIALKTDSELSTHQPIFKDVEITANEICNPEIMFHEHLNSRLLSLKPRDPIETFHFKKQHILNFNFYNSSKEHWAIPNEINAKQIIHYNMVEESLKFQGDITNQNNINVLEKVGIFNSKKTYSKYDLLPSNLMEIKIEDRSAEIEKEKNSDSSNMASFPLALSTGN